MSRVRLDQSIADVAGSMASTRELTHSAVPQRDTRSDMSTLIALVLRLDRGNDCRPSVYHKCLALRLPERLTDKQMLLLAQTGPKALRLTECTTQSEKREGSRSLGHARGVAPWLAPCVIVVQNNKSPVHCCTTDYGLNFQLIYNRGRRNGFASSPARTRRVPGLVAVTDPTPVASGQ